MRPDPALHAPPRADDCRVRDAAVRREIRRKARRRASRRAVVPHSLERPERRAADAGERQREDAAALRHRRRALVAGEAAVDRCGRARLPARQPARGAGRNVSRAGRVPSLRDVSAQRPHDQAADGSWRGPAVESCTREHLLETHRDHVRSEVERDDSARGRSDHPRDRPAEGHEVRPARTHPEQAPDAVLGPADVSRRARAPARRFR